MAKAGPLSPIFDKYEPPAAYHRQDLRPLLEQVVAQDIESGWHYYHLILSGTLPLNIGDVEIQSVEYVPNHLFRLTFSIEGQYSGVVIHFDEFEWGFIPAPEFYVNEGIAIVDIQYVTDVLGLPNTPAYPAEVSVTPYWGDPLPDLLGDPSTMAVPAA